MSYDETVAPHAGAWIETARASLIAVSVTRSRLTQARGLKLLESAISRQSAESRLTQARGLKQLVMGKDGLVDQVAPHAGAWIETQRH